MPNYETGYSNVGSFFSGLGGSILENTAKQKADEEERGRKQKGQALELLGGLMDQVQPGSRPLLLQSMADLIGLKGKQRSFWDELTGRNKTDMEAMVAERLKGVLGNVVGPEEYEKLKHVDAGWTPRTGGEPFQITRPIYEDRSQGKIALRDPQAEKLGLERERTKLNLEESSRKLQEKEAAILERQEYLKRLGADLQGQRDQELALIKAGGDVRKLAVALAKGKRPDDSHYEAAANQIAAQTGLNLDLLKERVGLTGALAGRAKAETAFMQSGGPAGTMPGLKPYQRIQTDIRLGNDAQTTFNAYNESRARATAAGQQLDQLNQQIAGQARQMGFNYDPARGQVMGPGGQSDFMGQMMFGRSIEQVQKLQGEKTRAEQELTGHRETLAGKYQQFYTVGPDGSVQPRQSFGGVATTGAPRVPSQPATGNISDVQEVIGTEARPATSFKVGQRVKQGGRSYRVKSVSPPTEDRPYGAVYLEAVR